MRMPCCAKKNTKKGAWSKQEDQKLINCIRKHGCWRTLPQAAGMHCCGKNCRLRCINYLRPDLGRGNFAEDEEDLIIKLHALLGNRWSLIAGRLPGRTDNEIENYWNTHLRRKLLNMGVDPNNHRQLTLKTSCPFHNNNVVDDSATVSCPKLANDQSAKISVENNEVVSDAASCLEDHTESCGGLPDLNLEFTISTPNTTTTISTITTTNSVHNVVDDQENHKKQTQFGFSRDDKLGLITPSSTLLLFQ